jgi:hypothetical protein
VAPAAGAATAGTAERVALVAPAAGAATVAAAEQVVLEVPAVRAGHQANRGNRGSRGNRGNRGNRDSLAHLPAKARSSPAHGPARTAATRPARL